MRRFVSYVYLVLLIMFFQGCITTKQVDQLIHDDRIILPIGISDKWGFADSKGNIVIDVVHDSVAFFEHGLALAKKGTRWGYLNKDGNWHIKPKYDQAGSFFYDCAIVERNGKSFIINRRGRKAKHDSCINDFGCGNGSLPPRVNKHFTKVNDKYEAVYTFYVDDGEAGYKIEDTTYLELDTVIGFGWSTFLYEKQGKSGLFDTYQLQRLVFDSEVAGRAAFLERFDLVYDEVICHRFLPHHAASSAAIRIDNHWGVVSGRGETLIEPKYPFVKVIPAKQMALLEYEPGSFGYQTFKGDQYFRTTIK